MVSSRKNDQDGSQDSRRREGDRRHEHRGDRGEQWRESDHRDHEDMLHARKRDEKFERIDDPEGVAEREGLEDIDDD